MTDGHIFSVLQPIPTMDIPDDKESTDALRDQAREAMLVTLREMSGHRAAANRKKLE